MEWIYFWKPVLVKTSHFTERKPDDGGREGMVVTIPRSPPSPFHCKIQWWQKKKKIKKLNETLGALEEDEHFSWKSRRLPEVLGEEEEKRGEEEKKKHQLDTKSVEQNKRRLQEMTSHSPSFPLLPQLVPETVSGCRNTTGSSLVRRLTGAVAGRGRGGRGP